MTKNLFICTLSYASLPPDAGFQGLAAVKYVGSVDGKHGVYVGLKTDDAGAPQGPTCSFTQLSVAGCGITVGSGDGIFFSKRYFKCLDGHAALVPVASILKIVAPARVCTLMGANVQSLT